MVFIYILQLKDNKWYIGKTESSKFRIDTHFDSKGSSFTKKYPPEEIYQIIPECDKYDEDKYVKKYMEKYGIDNVRGGSYSRLELTEEEKKYIQKELWGANDLCFICGEDHFIKDCPNNKDVKEEFKINNEYTIDTLLLDRILKRIIGFPINNVKTNYYGEVETAYPTLTGKRNDTSLPVLPNRRHFEHYLYLDNLTITEYVNNNKEIMSLYKSYIDTIIDYMFMTNEGNVVYENKKMIDRNNVSNRYKLKLSIEYKVKNFIVDLCYVKLNEFIQNKYHNDYLLTNFSINIDFKNDLCNEIYFNYLIEDYFKKIDIGTLDATGSRSLPHTHTYFRDYRSSWLFSKKHCRGCVYTGVIANIRVNGELHYGCDLKKNN